MQILSNNFVCEKEKSLKNHFWNLKFLYMDSNEHDMHEHIQAENSMKKREHCVVDEPLKLTISYSMFNCSWCPSGDVEFRYMKYEPSFHGESLLECWEVSLEISGLIKVIKTDWLERVYNSCFFACPQLQLQQQQQKNNVGYCCRFFSISLSYCYC